MDKKTRELKSIRFLHSLCVDMLEIYSGSTASAICKAIKEHRQPEVISFMRDTFDIFELTANEIILTGDDIRRSYIFGDFKKVVDAALMKNFCNNILDLEYEVTEFMEKRNA
mgnify:FL=1